MSDRALEERVAVLERQVRALQAALGEGDETVEQPLGVLEAGHRDFVARIKGGRA
jgi:hypothetical protein